MSEELPSVKNSIEEEIPLCPDSEGEMTLSNLGGIGNLAKGLFW